jgi:hypothetical protein
VDNLRQFKKHFAKSNFQYNLSATAAILFYKINSLESFKSLSSWVDILRQVSSEMI